MRNGDDLSFRTVTPHAGELHQGSTRAEVVSGDVGLVKF